MFHVFTRTEYYSIGYPSVDCFFLPYPELPYSTKAHQPTYWPFKISPAIFSANASVTESASVLGKKAPDTHRLLPEDAQVATVEMRTRPLLAGPVLQ
jgi:hypothetical protein